jgi:hypothetical protein
MYLGRFVRAALDTHKIHAGYIADTFRIRILDSFYLNPPAKLFRSWFHFSAF